jgi:hypothetical protein
MTWSRRSGDATPGGLTKGDSLPDNLEEIAADAAMAVLPAQEEFTAGEERQEPDAEMRAPVEPLRGPDGRLIVRHRPVTLPLRQALAPYRDAEEHLRDELWRVWLRVEYEIRRRWERGALPSVSHQAGLGSWGAEDIAGLFRFARAELGGDEGHPPDLGARRLLDHYLQHSAILEHRIELSYAAGVRLPLLEVVRRFHLDPRQRACLTFVLMPELDPHLLVAYRYLGHDPSCRSLDGRLLALLVYDSPRDRSRLAHDLSAKSPLLFYRLLEQEESPHRHEMLLYRRLRPAARLISLLHGAPLELDPELAAVSVVPALSGHGRFSSELVDRAVRALQDDGVLLVVQGPRGVGKRRLLQTAANRLGMRVILVNGRQLAVARPAELLPLVRGLLREARLLDAIPVIPDLHDAISVIGEREELPAFLGLLAAHHDGPLAVTVNQERRPSIHLRPVVQLELPIPSLPERIELWRDAVPELASDEAVALAERFAVTGGTIMLAARAVRAAQGASRSATGSADLDRAVRDQIHDRLHRFGRKLETLYDFEDLVAEDDLLLLLAEIVACVRERRQVREHWGLRGAEGVSVLFSGDPGVGKTMSATVLARALGLEIYEIDLSRVMSKWLGETEKHLAEIFDAAEPGHVVLLFNEADSLFGKRTTEVRSANDRYANLETNYLLQRLERFGGLAILTTNLGKAIDAAFRRRFAYDVQFTFPSSALRAELWQRAIPQRAQAPGIDFSELGRRFELSGGFIKVAVERAAFMAAGTRQHISMDLLIDVVERMYTEHGKLAPIGKLE